MNCKNGHHHTWLIGDVMLNIVCIVFTDDACGIVPYSLVARIVEEYDECYDEDPEEYQEYIFGYGDKIIFYKSASSSIYRALGSSCFPYWLCSNVLCCGNVALRMQELPEGMAFYFEDACIVS
jgi:hypothetical protein